MNDKINDGQPTAEPPDSEAKAAEKVGEAAEDETSRAISMIGARNEASVLFSAAQLKAMASAEPKAAQKPADKSLLRPDMAKESSGIVDIRALAASMSLDGEDGAPEKEDPLGLGSFAMRAPLLVTSTKKEGFGFTKIVALAFGALALLAIIAVVFYFSTKRSDSDSAAEAQIRALKEQLDAIQKSGGGNTAEAEALKQQIAAAKEPAWTPPPPIAGKAEPDKKPVGAVKKGAAKPGKAGAAAGAGAGTASQEAAAAAVAEFAAAAKAATQKPPETEAKKQAKSQLDDLLGGGLGAKSSAPVKEKLDRDDVKNGMASVASRVKGCGTGETGTLTLEVVIGTSGRVTSATAVGDFAGTPAGSCAAQAVRNAQFPKSQSPLTVKYPFKL